ncbi:MAG: dihydroorotate dehydrogenase [Planctomycetes bacterium]|nr:dihydroorotate dehydrogenase [Planctomycetota bacterium]
MLNTRIGSLELSSPLLTASGTFGHDPSALAFLKPGDLGALVLKTVTLEPRHGNPTPRMCEFTGGVMNSIGLENRGLEHFQQVVAPDLSGLAMPVIGNAGGHAVDDYVAMVGAMHEMPCIQAIEVNLSCPNVAGGSLPFATDPDAIQRVMQACREATDKPLWAKLSPNVTRMAPLALACESSGADAITVGNTVLGLAVDWRTRKPALGAGFGGMSGPAIRPIAMRMVYEAVQAVNIPVIACGGAQSADDILDFTVVVAAAVQIGTAVFRRPDAFSIIAAELRQILHQASTTLDELRGSLEWPGRVS